MGKNFSVTAQGENCKLCLQNSPLCDSHIIPEFVYTPLYDKSHRYIAMRSDPKTRNTFSRKGAREKILCQRCERLLSPYEAYACYVLEGQPQHAATPDLVKLEGVDYKKFKLFQLSILWRAGVSSHELFRTVDLGPHEERLRQMIVSGDPGKETEYPCLMHALFLDGRAARTLILSPNRRRLDGHICYRFVFGGFLWIFYATSHSLPPEDQHQALQEDGTLPLYFGDLRDYKFIVSQRLAFERTGKWTLPK